MKDKFLITGACGFVAQYFIEYLKLNHSNAHILGLDVLDKCNFISDNFTYKKLDLLDKERLKDVLENYRPDYIVHLASISSVSKSWQIPVESFNNNTNIFLNLVESVRQLGLGPRILSIGSSEEYGSYSEDMMPLNENYELRPNSPYAVARVSQEMLSKLYADSYGLDIVMTRSFNHIGPRQKDNFVVASFIKQLVNISENTANKVIKVGNVDLIRDFLDIRDVISGYVLILEKGKTGTIYNICSGNGILLKDIINMASDILNINVEIKIDEFKIRPTENKIIIGDNSKIKQDLGWEPKISFEQSLKDMIEYWKAELK